LSECGFLFKTSRKRNSMINYKKPYRIGYSRILSLFSNINKNIVLVLGNQRSGTTAIAAILAAYGDLRLTSDIQSMTSAELKKLASGEIPVETFIKRHSFEFSKEMMKECWLVLFYDKLRIILECRKNVFIMRDPRDNIRSILNRVGIAGNLSKFDRIGEIPGLWKKVVDNRWLGIETDNYINSLAFRWNKAAKMYLTHKLDFVLIKYEDFIQDKVSYIEKIAKELGVEKKAEIRDMVGIQFQKKGHPDISWEAFFGKENLRRIETICIENIETLGYKTSVV
jgi:hypothetical protein